MVGQPLVLILFPRRPYERQRPKARCTQFQENPRKHFLQNFPIITRYILKTPMWKHVDSLFLLYSWKEQHDVEELKHEKLGGRLANQPSTLYQHFAEVEPYIVPCYRGGLQKLTQSSALYCVAICSLLQSAMLPLELVNHRGLHLALVLLQRFLVLVKKEDVGVPVPERTVTMSVRNHTFSPKVLCESHLLLHSHASFHVTVRNAFLAHL